MNQINKEERKYSKDNQAKNYKKKKLRRLKIQIINYGDPQKNLRLTVYYKMPGDVSIPERNLCFHSYNLMEDVKNVKKIISVEHNKKYKLVSCNLMSIPGYEPPLELLVSRLRSLGDQAAYNLSETVETIITLIKSSKIEGKKRIPVERIFEKPSYKDFLKSTFELLNKLSEQFAFIVYRQSNFDDFNDHITHQISFNYKMISLLGNDANGFIRRLQKQGFPECVWMDKEYFTTMQQLIRLFLFSETDNFSPRVQIKRDGEFVKHNLKVIVKKFEEDDYREAFNIQIIDLKDNSLLRNESAFDEKNETKSLSISDKSRNYSLMVERNNFMNDTLKWIKASYPNLNILMVESEENKNNYRCDYRDIYFKQ